MLRERWAMIAIVWCTFVGVAAYFDLRSPESYELRSQVEIRSLTPYAPLVGIYRLDLEVDPVAAASRAANLAVQAGTLEPALRSMGEAAPPGYTLFGRVSATPAFAPGRVDIIVRDEDPERGIAAADAVAASLAARIERREVGRLERVIAGLRREHRALRSEARTDFLTSLQAKGIEGRLMALRTIRSIAEPAEVVRTAFRPAFPEFKPGNRTWPSIYVGLSVALIAAFVLDAVARRPRDVARLAAAAKLPVVGRIPRLGVRRRDAIRLAYDQLSVAAERLSDAPQPTIVLVTSPGPAAGKSTVALGIARAAADMGRRACLVECDLHRPVLALRLGIAGPGLAEHVAGHATLEECHSELDCDSRGRLGVIPAGTPLRRAADILASPRLRELLVGLRREHDVIVLDAPPVFATSDALAMVPLSDATLVCARAGHTPVDELEGIRAALERLGSPPAGLVVTAVAPRDIAARAAGRRLGRPSPRAA